MNLPISDSVTDSNMIHEFHHDFEASAGGPLSPAHCRRVLNTYRVVAPEHSLGWTPGHRLTTAFGAGVGRRHQTRSGRRRRHQIRCGRPAFPSAGHLCLTSSRPSALCLSTRATTGQLEPSRARLTTQVCMLRKRDSLDGSWSGSQRRTRPFARRCQRRRNATPSCCCSCGGLTRKCRTSPSAIAT